MTTRGHRELEYAFFTLIILGGVYVGYVIVTRRHGLAPAGGHPFGHWLGIIGTAMMLMTETLYSLRKRTRLFNRTGPVRNWLAAHIFMGIVGPFLVLMHTGLRFRGIAGFTMLLTILIVISGFIGRYLYGMVQRSGKQSDEAYARLATNIATARHELAHFEREKPRRVQVITRQVRPPTGRFNWLQKRQLQRKFKRLEIEQQTLQQNLKKLLQQKQKVEQGLNRNAHYQRLFSLWHLIHVPMGVTLFVSVFIHIGATIFFRAGLFG